MTAWSDLLVYGVIHDCIMVADDASPLIHIFRTEDTPAKSPHFLPKYQN